MIRLQDTSYENIFTIHKSNLRHHGEGEKVKIEEVAAKLSNRMGRAQVSSRQSVEAIA